MFAEAENLQLDLMDLDDCRKAVDGVGTVFNLAADMGGMGFIELNKAACMLSVLTSTHMLVAARRRRGRAVLLLVVGVRVRRRPATRPERPRAQGERRLPGRTRGRLRLGEALQRADVPALPEDFGLETRVARYHNVYGPYGTWDGGREKAPAAICRKVATAKLTGDHSIEIWGDGKQTRSFTYIDDCIEGTHAPDDERRRRADQHRLGGARLRSTTS